MSGYYGLIELLLVFGIVLGLGGWQLYSVRRDARRAGDKPRASGEGRAMHRSGDGIER